MGNSLKSLQFVYTKVYVELWRLVSGQNDVITVTGFTLPPHKTKITYKIH